MSVAVLDTDTIVAFVGDIFRRRGAESYLGECVSMSEHMLQCARLAELAGAGDELIAAALLHDIGHYTNEFPEDALERGIDNHHDSAGARVLEQFFPPLVTECVRQHVRAKRYLCATEPGYFDVLSDASVHSLRLQGGPMEGAEAAEFAKNAYLDHIIQVRKWDEGSKVAGVPVPLFEHYAPVLQRVADAHAGRAGAAR